MMNYTLDEIKKELFDEIHLLEERNPSFLNCRKCPFKGKCCIDNDIDIREDEWEKIEKFLDENEEARKKIKENFLSNRKCYFRTEECCLIHPIRPTNCIYTPYQIIQNVHDKTLTYSKRDAFCNFTTKEIPCTELFSDENPLLYLKEENEYYLFLNHWYFHYENQSIFTYKMTGEERLREYFQKEEKTGRR